MSNLISYIRSSLQGIYPEGEATAIARMILCEKFGLSQLDIYMGKDIHFSAKQQQELENIILRLKKYEPIQYILGHAEFCGLCFEVNPNVLIPRPETAELVSTILAEHPVPPGHILDVGSGSGCIPITLSHHWPESNIISWDVSNEALKVALANNHRLKTNVCFEHHNILQEETDKKSITEFFDLIVSNPPYIKECERQEMECNVLNWEPSLALFVPDTDPLIFYRAIALKARWMLKPQGYLYFEINRAQGRQTIDLLQQLGFKIIELRKDLSGNDRIIKAQMSYF